MLQFTVSWHWLARLRRGWLCAEGTARRVRLRVTATSEQRGKVVAVGWMEVQVALQAIRGRMEQQSRHLCCAKWNRGIGFTARSWHQRSTLAPLSKQIKLVGNGSTDAALKMTDSVYWYFRAYVILVFSGCPTSFALGWLSDVHGRSYR
ncbi:hypothetical protein BDR04DRAFT_1112842 [Suillus decipiens]|nr:hypothetical protein BDR04DRAFT_1112842 [Suillus decipiens]